MPTYRALQVFPYGKNKLFVGQLFDAKNAIGDLLVKVGKAQQVYEPQATEGTAPDPKSQSDRGRYQRRDMIAEKAAAAPKKRGRPRGAKNKSSPS